MTLRTQVLQWTCWCPQGRTAAARQVEPTHRLWWELVLPGCQEGYPGKALYSVVLLSSADVVPKPVRPAGPPL